MPSINRHREPQGRDFHRPDTRSNEAPFLWWQYNPEETNGLYDEATGPRNPHRTQTERLRRIASENARYTQPIAVPDQWYDGYPEE